MMTFKEAVAIGEKAMAEERDLSKRIGCWKSTFDNGCLELTCPMALNEIDLEYFNHVIEGIKRQVNRWSLKWAATQISTPPNPSQGESSE